MSSPASTFSARDIAALLTQHFALEATPIEENTPLFSSGLLDSFHLLELLGQLETAAGVRIAPGEVSLANLDTPVRIVALLNRKRAAA